MLSDLANLVLYVTSGRLCSKSARNCKQKLGKDTELTDNYL